MKKKKIKLGLVGCGRISSKHITAINQLPEIELVALCDINTKIVNVLSKQLRVTKIFTNFSQMIKDKTIDVIDICTPSGWHHSMAVQALGSGKDIILEKPIALSSSNANNIIQSSIKYNKIFLPVLQNRFNPAINFLKNKIPKLGTINYIDSAVLWYRPQSYYNDSWHGTRKMDGGALMNQGIHYVDMILNLMADYPKEISAFGGTYGHKMECEDVISVNIKFNNGKIASLRANTISYPENFEGYIIIFFEKATVKIGGKSMNEIIYWKGVNEKEAKKFFNCQSNDIYGSGHLEVIKNMCDIKKKKFNPYVTGEEALYSIKIIEAAYKSMIKGKNIYI